MQPLGGQGAPEIGGDVRGRRMRQGVGPAFAVSGKTVGGQAAGQGQPLKRPPGVIRVSEQRRPFVRSQRIGPSRRRRQEGRPQPKLQPQEQYSKDNQALRRSSPHRNTSEASRLVLASATMSRVYYPGKKVSHP